jgi:hypothetical protein
MATSALSFLCSDAIQQAASTAASTGSTRDATTGASTIHQYTKPWDAVRSARMCALGAFLHAPFIHVWLRAADRVFGAGFSWAKLLADQVLAFPTFLGVFLAANEAAKAYTCQQGDAHFATVAAQVEHKLRADFVDTYSTGLLLWPAAQLVNFRFVMPELRLLFMNSTSLVVRCICFQSSAVHNYVSIVFNSYFIRDCFVARYCCRSGACIYRRRRSVSTATHDTQVMRLYTM